MAYFHYRCGERITLLNDNCTAVRNDSEFDHGLVISAEPLTNDVLFEIKIDRKVNSWSGSLEIGVVDCDPLHFEFPPCASKIQSGSWIMSATSLFRNGLCLVESYGLDLDKLNQDDRIGLLRTSEGDLIFYINGESQGVAAEGLPSPIYAIVDLYGKCVQVTITSPALREHNNDDCLSGSSVLAIENDVLNVTLGGDLSELSLSSSNSLDIRMDMNVSVSLPEESTRQDKVRFHDRCGFLVKLSNGNRSAERRRPLDEFNNGVVMTHRPLKDSELFEIRIDRLVDKWSGSIEMGITTHNPSSLVFPATMTNMRSGTIMMSGCGILTNGKGTRREYGDYNLDELSEGDRVGMMRKPDGNLHYFINGIDQGIAAQRVPTTVWAVIDLYGMTIKVSIVERDEREEQNLITRKNTRDHNQAQPIEDTQPLPDYYDRLTFHPNCGTHAQVINNGRTAHRPNAVDDFNNGVVLTARPLKIGELFEVRLDRVVTKWAGSIEIGVTTHNPVDLDFPFTMTNVRSGTWMMTGSGIMHNGTIVLEQYGVNLDRLQVGDRVGVVRKENGTLHFFVNAVDQGSAATNVPEKVYGVIDLYGQAVESSIVDQYDYRSPDTMISSFSNTLYSDLRFHHVHGRNARIINNGVTAMRPRPLAEFNEAIVFSNRPLRDGELFEVCLDTIVDRWSGSIELGVTAVRPDDLELPSTATDLYRDTIMLSGSSVMVNGKTLKNNYLCDLDMLTSGVKLGIMRSADKSLEFYKNGVPQGVACTVTNTNIYAVVDLYGQCAQVSISCASPMAPLASVGTETCPRSDTSVSLQATSVIQPPIETDLHRFSAKGKGFVLSENARIATRNKDFNSCIVCSSTPLVQDELFEISIVTLLKQYAGNLAVGVSAMPPGIGCNSMSSDCCYLSGNELRYKNKILQFFTPSLNWLNCEDRIGILRTQDGNVKIFLNGEELAINFPSFTDALYGVFELRGACSEVSVLSHKTPLSPLNSMRLQDSLEWTIDQEQAPSDLIAEDKEVAIDGDAGAVKHVYEFNENHGRNIELIDERKVARRVASYNQGIVIVQPALEFNSKVEVVVEQLDGFWQSSLIVGLICGPADRLTLPVNALSLKGSSCVIVANDWISVNGAKMRSNYGQALAKLKVGDTVGLILSETKHLQLVVNGVEGEGLAWVYPNGNAVHAVFDLYGQCQQIQIVNTPSAELAPSTSTSADCEKADLESCEKERSNTNLSLPLQTSASCSTNAATVNNSKPSMHTPITIVSKSCPYKEEAEKMKSKLLLPDHYFAKDDPVCYCTNCFKVKCEDGEKENGMEGWVRFPLRGAVNNAEKWHAAFYASKIGAVRCILDRGQPLTKGQAQFCNLTAQKADDVQVVFYPSLDSCKMQSRKMDNKEVHVAFQLFVKPGAYSISRESDCVEWSTKETGALVLNALLFQIR